MDYLGLFCLGAFVGTISVIGVRHIKSVDEWQKVLLAILPVVLSGVTITFVDRFKYSPAVGCYPLGLVAALMWIYIDKGVENFTGTQVKGMKLIGALHIFASSLFTLLSLILVSIPAYLQIEAERGISKEKRAEILSDERKKALISIPEKELPKPVSTPAPNK